MVVRLIYFYALLLVALNWSCSESPLRKARRAAEGTGNPEMHRVVDAYADQPEQLEAATFLLENLGRHGAATFELVDGAGRVSDSSIYRPWVTVGNYRARLDSLGLAVRRCTRADAEAMTAEYLIRNIDQAFEGRERYPWARNYQDSLFRTYVLPYRVGSEKLSDWRRFFRERYEPMVDTMTAPKTVRNVAQLVIRDIREWYRYDGELLMLESMPTPEEAYAYGKGECFSIAGMFVLGLRAMGIAAAVDVIPVWGTSRGGHAEAVCWDEYGREVRLFTGNNLAARPVRVYRKRFDRPENEEVTERYALTTRRLRVALEETAVALEEYGAVALATYGADSWRVALQASSVGTERNRSTGREEVICEFRNLGQSIIYLPVVVREPRRRVEAIGEPFKLNYKGWVEPMRPDTATRRTIHLQNLLENPAAFRAEDYRLFYWEDGGWREHSRPVEPDGESKREWAYCVREVPTGSFYRLVDRHTGRTYRNRPFTFDGWAIERF